MLTQPAGHDGCVPRLGEVICRRWVSRGMLTGGALPQGDTTQPRVTVFSSSSKNVKTMAGSEVVHFPKAVPPSKLSKPVEGNATADPADARHTLKKEVTAAVSNQRAAYLRPRGSRDRKSTRLNSSHVRIS